MVTAMHCVTTQAPISLGVVTSEEPAGVVEGKSEQCGEPVEGE